MSDHEQLWTAVAQLLRAQVSEAVWFSTFQDVVPLDSDASVLLVSAPNAHARDRILSRYLPLVRDALDEIGSSHLQFSIEVQLAEAEPVAEWVADAQREGGQPSTTTTTPEPQQETGGMNPRYTFETFVKGASNQFALAAALRVAETPGRSYNPLFIYGSAGLGKTHLLHAIGHYVQSHYQHDIVRYVSTETFLNEYVDAIRTNTTANFKRR
ncbi:MAG: DnaA ATPase domain-containing protein, partial [Ilumatobacteraceae bacterium]